MHVGEGREEFGVEAPGAFVTLPSVPGWYELVDAVLGQRVDQPLEITSVLGLRMGDPQAADGPVLVGDDVHAETLPDGDVHPGMLHRHECAPAVGSSADPRRTALEVRGAGMVNFGPAVASLRCPR